MTRVEVLIDALVRAENRFHRLDGFLAEEAARTNGERFDPWAASAAQGRDEISALIVTLDSPDTPSEGG